MSWSTVRTHRVSTVHDLSDCLVHSLQRDALEQEASDRAALDGSQVGSGAAAGRDPRGVAQERTRRQTARDQLEWLYGRAKAKATAWQVTVEWWQAYAASSHRRMLWRTRKARKGAAAAAKASSAAEQRREFAMRKERDFLLTVKAREECAASCGISTGSGDC